MDTVSATTAAATAMKVRSRGFTMFELILVIIIVALGAGLLAGRVLSYQEVAEKAAMEQTVGAMRSALAMQTTGLLARGRTEDIQHLAAVNPVTLLTELPKNYAGEYYGVPNEFAPGTWYFDLKSRQLVYLVQHGTHFRSGEEGMQAIRYQVVLVYNDWLPAAGGKPGRKEIGGVVLKEAQPYKWDVK